MMGVSLYSLSARGGAHLLFREDMSWRIGNQPVKSVCYLRLQVPGPRGSE